MAWLLLILFLLVPGIAAVCFFFFVPRNSVISINQGQRKIQARRGTTLLQGLGQKDIYLASACGGKGSCGTCKCVVLGADRTVLPLERPYLTQEDLQAHKRLACQVRIHRDLQIEIPAPYFDVKRYSARVCGLNRISPDVMHLCLRLPEGHGLTFEAGQFAEIELPTQNRKSQPIHRAYSFASDPGLPDELEFLVRAIPGGMLSGYIHTELKLGDELDLIAPMGNFRCEPSRGPLIFVAASSGLAPIRSMLLDLMGKGLLEGHAVWVFFAARSQDDLIYRQWLEELQARQPAFAYVPVLSGTDARWTGRRGMITAVLNEYLQGVIPRESQRQAYLCGNPGMIDACVNVLKKHGLSQDSIFYDKFL